MESENENKPTKTRQTPKPKSTMLAMWGELPASNLYISK